MKDIRDRQVLITGAAGGIGRALALEFAKAGADVMIADVKEKEMEETAREVESRGRRALCVRTDLSRPAEVKKLAEEALRQMGRVDVLVNNAGVVLVSEVKNITVKEWERTLAVNLRAPVLLTQHLLPHMIELGSGHVVNVASMAGLVGFPAAVPYCTSKFGLVGFSESLRAEVRRYGIRVTAVCPGFVATPMMNNRNVRGLAVDIAMDRPPRFITISAEKAARDIMRAVKRDRSVVIPATRGLKLLIALKRLSPALLETPIRWIGENLERLPIVDRPGRV